MGILLSIIQCLGSKSDVDEDNERPRSNTHFPHSYCVKSDYTRHQSDDTLGACHQWRQMKYLTVSGPNLRLKPSLGHASVNDGVKDSTVVIELNRQKNVIGRPEKINCRVAPVHASVNNEVKGSTVVIKQNRQENVIGRPEKINCRVAPVHARVNDEVKGSTVVIERNRHGAVIGRPEKMNCRVAPVHTTGNDEVKGSTVVIERNRHGNDIGRPEKINCWVAPAHASVNDEVKGSTVVPKRLTVISCPEKIKRNRQKNVISCPEKINCRVAPPLPEGRWIKHYSSCHRILLMGEGDFPSLLVWPRLLVGLPIWLQHLSILKNYGYALPNLMELSIRRCKVMHEVDVTQMANDPFLGVVKFDRIVFNFPFAGFFKNLSRDLQLRRHRRLVRLFLKNAKEMISENGEIHISHKTNGFHIEWKIEAIANSHKLRLIDAVDFNVEDYPGYNTKRGFGGDRNFDCNPSKTYKFGLKS